MPSKISSLDQNYDCIDIEALSAELEIGDREAMSEVELAETIYKQAFVKDGTIPNRMPLAQAKDFGLRHAFFDVWRPEDNSKTGIWKLEDADGNPWIARDADYD